MYSSQVAAGGADDTVLLAGLPSDDMARHQGTFGFYTTVLMREAEMESDPNDHISGIFSTANIMSGKMPAWKKDAFNGEFEAEVICTPVGGWRYAPASVTYQSPAIHRRRTV
jgi:hypothetical protein